jgi:replicative DNA helicase
MSERVNIDAEKAVIGGLMLDPRMAPIVAAIVPPEDFHHPKLEIAMRGIVELSARREAIDALTVSAVTKGAIDPATISTFMHGVGTAANVEAHARIVAENARVRRLANAGAGIAAKSRDTNVTADELEAHARSLLAEAAKRRGLREAATTTEMSLELHEDLEAAFTRREQGIEIVGVPSGLASLDALTTGWHPGTLILLGARPATGKSALAHKLVVTAAKHGTALVFQIEMRRKAFFLRMVADQSGVDSRRIRQANIDQEEVNAVTEAAQALSLLPIRVDDDGAITIDEIRARTLRLHAESPLSIVVIDYLQKIRAGQRRRGDSREREVNEIIGALQALAKEINVPIIALAALNRECEQRPDRRPQASDIRESGGAESDADVVLLLYRASKYRHLRRAEREGIVEAIVAKNRDETEGTAILRFMDTITRIVDADDDSRERYLESWKTQMRGHGGRRAYGGDDGN